MGATGKSIDWHGMSKTRINNIYHSMKERCYCETQNTYKRYGGRGIKVCDEWLGKYGFRNFYNWAMSTGYDYNAKRGECTIDRINVDGNYEPSNCRWVDAKIQRSNQRPRKRNCK